MSAVRDEIVARLAREPFEPFAVETMDGRRLEIRGRDQAVANSLALSVIEAAFSVTVVGWDQVRAIARD
jgi:cyanophycinase-like exopeptidase